MGVPGDLVVRTLGFHCQGLGSVPGWGTSLVTKKKKKKKRSNKEINIKQIEKYFFLLMITVRISYITDISVSYIYPFVGLPWWLNGKESACQRRRRGFYPLDPDLSKRVGKVP